MLTNEAYVAAGGVICPFCQSNDIRGDDVDISHGAAFQNCTCNACHREWTDEYKLTGFTPEEE